MFQLFLIGLGVELKNNSWLIYLEIYINTLLRERQENPSSLPSAWSTPPNNLPHFYLLQNHRKAFKMGLSIGVSVIVDLFYSCAIQYTTSSH